MSEVKWDKIAVSSGGSFETYYARVNNGFLIKNVEIINQAESKESINFFAVSEKNTCDWEFEEL